MPILPLDALEAATLKERLNTGALRNTSPCECESSSGEPQMSCIDVADDILSALHPGTLHVMLSVVP